MCSLLNTSERCIYIFIIWHEVWGMFLLWQDLLKHQRARNECWINHELSRMTSSLRWSSCYNLGKLSWFYSIYRLNQAWIRKFIFSFLLQKLTSLLKKGSRDKKNFQKGGVDGFIGSHFSFSRSQVYPYSSYIISSWKRWRVSRLMQMHNTSKVFNLII